jgi:F-type H+-transporting ATPase subunit b
MAEPVAHSEAPAGGHGGFPPFQSEHFPSQLLWLTLTFVLLYALMSRVALPRIGSILAERSKRVADDLKTAQGFKEQSEAASAAYEKALADARARAQSIANATRERQAGEAQESQKRLEAQLHERLAAAERSIDAKRTAAMANVRTIAADTAAAIVKRLIGKAPADQEVAAALAEVIKQ